ncbi:MULTISPECIES: hypothetical protein [Bacteroides]|jgi:hypothetical protein|uniref:Uncharacterized protein n=1 Tax=Bacteroides thetaiotaomicron TaxID=818 RepID=A0A414HEP3_BACT4|nr:MULTISPECIES: hypothetical protein [Bacteroides]MBU9879113.1 hypothetical protein [Bacteroides sp. MSK.20.82]MCS3003811.1 hypothetical protein [Bacteroides thetaiotaomicron]MCS3365979.1 hypothetical protein [Bacteroides thetaiotaomicron]RGQ45154.1 hypothetical protein DWY97_03170 [Bacteroides thetaiotaomicron]RHD83066.1 hypothetical protein DW780_21585 [Bacteroides thetaiotaomicron]
MKQVIFILLSVGLAYLGSVQVARFLYGRYRSAVRLYRDLQLFFRERGKGKFVVTIRIPRRELFQEENVLLAELPIEEEQHEEQAPETGMSEEISQVGIEEEEDYVLVEVQGESYSLSESITAEELQQMGSVLSCKNAPIEEAAKAAETIYKIHDSPMFQAIKKAAGERVRELLERVAEEAPKEVQSGNFDYKRFIKT